MRELARSNTCCSMVLPAMTARALPGKRDEANLAGITPRIRVGTFDHSMKTPFVILEASRLRPLGEMVVKSLLLYPLSGLLLLTAFSVLRAEEKVTKPAVPAPEPRVNIEPRVKPSKKPEDPAAKREPSIRVETNWF